MPLVPICHFPRVSLLCPNFPNLQQPPYGSAVHSPFYSAQNPCRMALSPWHYPSCLTGLAQTREHSQNQTGASQGKGPDHRLWFTPVPASLTIKLTTPHHIPILSRAHNLIFNHPSPALTPLEDISRRWSTFLPDSWFSPMLHNPP
jgi:hypothetical protein